MAGLGKEVYTFPKGICPQVNIIAQVEFKLAYFKFAAQLFCHYTTGSSLKKWCGLVRLQMMYDNYKENFYIHSNPHLCSFVHKQERL